MKNKGGVENVKANITLAPKLKSHPEPLTQSHVYWKS